jgi:hypothetical protein
MGRKYLFKRKLSQKEKKLLYIIKNEFSGWINSLTSEEKHAIRKYTKNSFLKKEENKFYRKLNDMLSEDNPQKSDEYYMLMEYANIISGSIKRHKTQRDIICYRGVSNIPVENAYVGKIVKYKQFISTSLFKRFAFDKKYRMIIHIPKGTNAAYINDISRYPGQYEILIDKDYNYKLLSVKGNVYEMEVYGRVKLDKGNNLSN